MVNPGEPPFYENYRKNLKLAVQGRIGASIRDCSNRGFTGVHLCPEALLDKALTGEPPGFTKVHRGSPLARERAGVQKDRKCRG